MLKRVKKQEDEQVKSKKYPFKNTRSIHQSSVSMKAINLPHIEKRKSNFNHPRSIIPTQLVLS